MPSIAILITNLSVVNTNLHIDGIAHVEGDPTKYGWGVDVSWKDSTESMIAAAKQAALDAAGYSKGNALVQNLLDSTLSDKCSVFIGTSSI